jgi:hypothetical protein
MFQRWRVLPGLLAVVLAGTPMGELLLRPRAAKSRCG